MRKKENIFMTVFALALMAYLIIKGKVKEIFEAIFYITERRESNG